MSAIENMAQSGNGGGVSAMAVMKRQMKILAKLKAVGV
jgi:hypothetical protein